MMSLIQTKLATEYPESDGEPMGETDWHIDWTIRLRDLLKWRYRDQNVYVGSDLILYYEEGNPSKSVVPDGFVALNCSSHKRRIFKIWTEGRVPDVAFEFTSLSSKRKDSIHKPRIYAEIGVQEYFVYDPEREYLKPPLQGYRLTGKAYEPIEPDQAGRFHCQTLGLLLKLEEDDLAILDAEAKRPLLTQVEAEKERADREWQRADREWQRAESERQRAESEKQRAELEKQRVQLEKLRADAEAAAHQVAQAEVERLRKELKRLKGET